MAPEVLLALVVVVALNVYALSAGADFGGGVWDLFATGPRAKAQRELIYKAVAPIWEANHVWLIVVIVVLFAGFPVGFRAITTALHIPLTLMLFGIVMRGSAFVFRSHDSRGEAQQKQWSRIFEVASIITPIMLGISLGAVVSGTLRMDANQRVITDFISSWLAPFPVSLGVFTLTLFAFLAAVYLAVEAKDPALQDDFRRRALVSSAAVFVLAWVTLFLASSGAPELFHGLTKTAWSSALHVVIGLSAVGAIATLFTRRFALARVFAIVQVSGIVWGWALAQQPFLVVPDLTIHQGIAPAGVMNAMLLALAGGGVLLVPSFAYLYGMFKR